MGETGTDVVLRVNGRVFGVEMVVAARRCRPGKYGMGIDCLWLWRIGGPGSDEVWAKEKGMGMDGQTSRDH